MREKASSGAHPIISYTNKNDIEELKIPEFIVILYYLRVRV